MKIIPLLLFFLAFINNVFAQNTDPLSYHSSRQLTDSSYSIKKPNGDSTIFIFTGNEDTTGAGAQGLQQVTEQGSASSHKITVGNLNVSGIKEYANDSIAAIDGNLRLNDVYKTGNLLKVVLTLPQSLYFTFTIDNTDGTAEPHFNVFNYNNNLADSFKMTINWGDGNITAYNGNYIYQPAHTFTSNQIFNISIIFDDPTKVTNFETELYNTRTYVSSINNVAILSQLYNLNLTGNKFTSFNPSVALPAGLNTLTLSLDYDSLTFNPSIALPAGLVNLNLQESQMRNFAPTLPLPATLKNIDLGALNWTSAQVNEALIYLNGQTFNAGTKNLNIIQSEKGEAPAPPTGAGLTAMNNMIANEWIITHD